MKLSHNAICVAGLLAGAPCVMAQAHDAAVKLKTLYQFPGGGDGLEPWGGLTDVGGTLYGTTLQGGAYGRGAVYSIDPNTGTEKLVYCFAGGRDASEPQAGLIAVGHLLYGTSNIGGANGYGSVYSVNPKTGAEKVIFSFTPAMGGGSGSSLVQAGGYLYGTTYGGGTGAGYGSVFKVNIATGAGTMLYAFTGGADGAFPQYGLAYASGILYGTTTAGAASGAGTIFSVNSTTGAETTLFTFDGAAHGGGAYGGVIDVGGVLYGTAAYGGSTGAGAVFAFSLATGTESIIYNFTGGADGSRPLGALIDVGGTLYGTTDVGGATGSGTVFSVNTSTGAETTLYSFPGGAGGAASETPLIDVDGTLYGTDLGPQSAISNHGTVFRIVLATNVETTLHEFMGVTGADASPLIDVSGALYGVNTTGGANYAGTVFKTDPATGALTTVYDFTGGIDGGSPNGALVAAGTALYGVTIGGGANNGGTIYRIDLATSAETVVYSFPATLQYPTGPLLMKGGLLYGITGFGGNSANGSVFAFNPTSRTLTTTYSFTGGADGSEPLSGVVENDGHLYGTTYGGGTGYQGTVFDIDTATGLETVLYSFTGRTDGGSPYASPTYLNGTLYGTTGFGGDQTAACFGGCGVVYSINLANRAYTVLHAFDYISEGAASIGSLLAVDGTLYGGTWGNGEPSWGTIFTYDTATASFNTIYNFTGGKDGAGPEANLIKVGGTFYGSTTEGDTYNSGTIFSLKP